MHCLVAHLTTNPIKTSLVLNQRASISHDGHLAGNINQTLCRKYAFPLSLQKWREGLLFIIFQYVFKIFSLLAVLGQVIPGGSESPFRAAGLRQCRAWNPITSAAMLALWHQTPSMQNATAGVYQQRAPQFSCCKGVHWWVASLTRGRRDDTGDTDEGQSGAQKTGRGAGERGVGTKFILIIRVRNYWDSCWWTVPPGRGDGGERRVMRLGHEGITGGGHRELLLKGQCTQNILAEGNSIWNIKH